MKNTLLTSFFIVMMLTSYSQSNTPLKLWYNQPSGNTWEKALPIGNGRLGAMVYGNPGKEIIQLNESSVWTGGPNSNDNPDALAALPEIRKLVFEGKQGQAQSLAGRTMSSKINGMKYQPVGNLNLAFPGHEKYTGYYRELNLENAIATTIYTANGVKYTREVFASVPAQIVIMRITASTPGALSFIASLNSPQKVKINTKSGNELTLSGITNDHEGVKGSVKFYTSVKIKTEGGSTALTDSSVNISKATSAIIYISIATNFINYHDISADEVKRCHGYLEAPVKKDYQQLRESHITAYQHYFNRVKLGLGPANAVDKPTDVRLKTFATKSDPQFAALYFQFGRYLLISCSQPGGQPANLQGIWNDKMDPPWDSKYTININTEMNYWPAEKDNLAEMHDPLIQMVRDLSETGKQTAKTMYGARGWMAHHNTDIWRITGPVDGIFWGVWSMGGAWLSQHLWEKYLYNGDKKYLASIYPILKGAATFFVDDLVEEPANKWLVINPGTSPENAPEAHGGSSFGAGVTMDNQIVFDMFSTTIRAAEILNKDAAFVDTLRLTRKRLPPMHIGQYGQLQEWLDDVDDPNDKHRHISHLYGLFPSSQISAHRTPELFSAANTTLIQRGDISTGWSMGWKVNWWARLFDGNHAYKLIQNQLSPVGANGGGGGTYDNLFDAHAPFQIDGNFGCTSGITEMLMQCQDGLIHLLPALPDVWMKEGLVKGLRARGGLEIVELAWKDGKITKLVISSKLGGNCRVRVPNELRGQAVELKPAKNENTNLFFYTETIQKPVISAKATLSNPSLPDTVEYDFKTIAGKTYTLLIK